MRLRTLHLQNYRRFEDQTIEFPDGLIGIVGENGAGKTTILEAVAWALYGPDAARTSKELVKREGAPPQTPCRVELEFELGGDAYRLVRELRGANLQPSAVLYKNAGASPEAETSTAVTERIRRLLGLDMQSFFTSVFARQRELNALSDARPGERKKRVLRMLRIALVDVALTNLRSEKRISAETVDRLKGVLQDVEVLRSTLASLRQEVVNQEAETARLQAERRRGSSELQSVRAERDRWGSLERKHRAGEAVIAALSEKSSAAEQALTDVDAEISDLRGRGRMLPKQRNLSLAYGRLEMEEAALRELQVKFNARAALLQKLNQAVLLRRGVIAQGRALAHDLRSRPKVDRKRKAAKRQEKKLLKEAKVLEKASGDLEAQVRGLTAERRDLRAHLQSVKDLGPNSPCPTCGRKLGKLHSELSGKWTARLSQIDQDVLSKQAAVREAEERGAELQRLLDGLRIEQEQLEEVVLQRAKDVQRISDLRREAVSAGEQIKGSRDELATIGRIPYNPGRHEEIRRRLKVLAPEHEKYLRLEQDVRRIPKLVSKRKSWARRYSSARRALASSEKRVDAIGYDAAKHTAAVRAFENQRGAVEAVHRGIVQARGELKLGRHKVQEQRRSISQELAKRKTIAREAKKIADLTLLEEAFQGFRMDLISRIRPLLAWRTGDLLRTLTQGRYPEVELDDDYELHIREEGKLFPLPRFSGGEEDLANLCLRIAVSQVVAERGGATPMNVIVLDEIFGSQDATRKSNILRSLKSLSAQFRQVILVTHVEDVKEALP